jgi:surface antigen
VSLPLLALFSLGTSALSFLLNSSSSTDSTSSISTTTQGLYEGPAIAGDTYDWGNCTWWVYAMRLKAGDPIPNTWHNAATWAFYAAAVGYQVNHIPAVGSIMQISTVDNGLGHVAYVSAVDATTGDWTISEMNVKGLDIVDLKTYPPAAAIGFDFIHDKVVAP